MKVVVGAKLKDNDPRMGRRVLTIVLDADTHVIAINKAGSVLREFRILKRRIYADGKPRKNGFDLLP